MQSSVIRVGSRGIVVAVKFSARSSYTDRSVLDRSNSKSNIGVCTLNEIPAISPAGVISRCFYRVRIHMAGSERAMARASRDPIRSMCAAAPPGTAHQNSLMCH